jgi:hypothetical protein
MTDRPSTGAAAACFRNGHLSRDQDCRRVDLPTRVVGFVLVEPLKSAIHSQSVWCFRTAFQVLSCHPWPCMSLNLRLLADSIPSALTNLFVANGLQKSILRGNPFRNNFITTGSPLRKWSRLVWGCLISIAELLKPRNITQNRNMENGGLYVRCHGCNW